MNSHIENLLLESLPGNNLTPRDLKSTDRFTAEENRIQKGENQRTDWIKLHLQRICFFLSFFFCLKKKQILLPHSSGREKSRAEKKVTEAK